MFEKLRDHPPGLRVLFFTEMWERFSFYVMMALLMLYMNDSFGWSDKIKGLHYGFFNGVVYLLPILGGWMADKFLGYRKSILIGASTLLVGYLCLAGSSLELLILFYIGLIVIAIGSGLFKSNISVLLGKLYKNNPGLKDDGYNIFYMGINVGALASAPVASVLRHKFSFTMAFGAAAAGMAISFIIFELGKKKYINALENESNIEKNDKDEGLDEIEKEKKQKQMSAKETKQRVVSLIILLLIAFFFWAGFYQDGATFMLFAKRSTEHYKLLTPEVYRSFNPLFVLIFTPILVYLFSKLRKKGKEPDTPQKISLGMFLAGIGMLVMMVASLLGGNKDMNIMSPAWLISTYMLVTISELLISPMGLSYVSKVAPPKLQGSMMGFWMGAGGLGATAAGLFAGFYSSIPHHIFFLIIAVALIFAGLLVTLFMDELRRFG